MSRQSSPTFGRRVRRFARAALDTYSIRLSLGLVVSLLLMVGLTRVPVHQPTDFVGWGPPSSYDRIQLADLSTERPEEQDAERVHRQAADVPVTTQAPRRTESSEPDPTPAEAPAPPADEEASPEASSRMLYAAQLTALGPGGERPQIVGGRGSFYLRIDYPEEARRRGIQGRVILDFVVDTEGRTQDVRVLKSLHPLCDSSAVAALEQTRFVPGRRDGEPIPVRMRLPVRFRLVNLTAEKNPSDTAPAPLDGQK